MQVGKDTVQPADLILRLHESKPVCPHASVKLVSRASIAVYSLEKDRNLKIRPSSCKLNDYRTKCSMIKVVI